MKLSEFILSRFPYWERAPLRFSSSLFGEGIHLICGPNGVGKSTVCRSLKALLFPETLPKAMPLSLWSRWEACGKEFVLQRDEWATVCSSKEGEMELAKLPDARFASCYFSSIEELLQAQDHNLASLIAREITGGYDPEKIEASPLFSPPRFHGRSEWKELMEAEKEFRDAQRKGALWKKEGELLEEKRKELAVAVEKERKREQIGRALAYRRLLKRKKNLDEKRERFPKALHAMTGREETLFFSLEEREKSLSKRLEELILELELLDDTPVMKEEDLLVLEVLTRKIEEGEKRRAECLLAISRLNKELSQSERLLGLTREELTAHAERNLLFSQKKWALWKEYKARLSALDIWRDQLSASGKEPLLRYFKEKELFFPLLWEAAMLLGIGALALQERGRIALFLGIYACFRVGYTLFLWSRRRSLRAALGRKEAKQLQELAEKKEQLQSSLSLLEAEESSLLSIGEILSSELGSHLLQWERSYAALLALEEEKGKGEESLQLLYSAFQAGAPQPVAGELASLQVCVSFLRKELEESSMRKEKEKRLLHEKGEIEKKLSLLREEKSGFLAPFGGELPLFYSCLAQWKEFLPVEKERVELELELSTIQEEELYPFSTWSEDELALLLEQMNSLAEKKEALLIEIVRKERDIEEGKRGAQEEQKGENISLSRAKLHSRFQELLIAKGGRLLIEEAQKRLVAETEPEVYQIASRFFAEFTRGSYRFLCPRLGGRDYQCEESATLRRQSVQELSTATKMQLLLAVRLAFTEVNEANSFSLPLFWDETLTTSDPLRLRAMIETLVQVGKKRQFFYFTSSPEEQFLWKESAEREGVPFHFISIDVEGQVYSGEQPSQESSFVPLASIIEAPEAQTELAKKGVLYWHQLETLFQTGATQPLLPEEISRIQKQLAGAPRSSSAKKKSGSELILLLTSLSVAPRYFSPLIELYEEVAGDSKEWLTAIKQKKNPGLKGFRKEVLERLTELLSSD